MLRYLAPIACALMLGAAACGGRTAPGDYWTPGNHNHNNNNVTIPPNCGDGIVDSDEECDDGAANSDTRPDACRRACRLPACGDNVRDSGEACDSADLGGADCMVLGFDGGLLSCGAACNYNTTQCTLCGDGVCTGDEWQTCPWDCETLCGNGVCEPGETPEWCPEDCRGECGDGICDPGEEGWCEDCGWCGNGICEPGEEGWCEDCGWCGDGICSPGEAAWCPEDCGGWCGNGICEPGEEGWCEDCGTCGNGFCEPGEPQWCPEDCAWCGNGQCEPGEDPVSCPQDCGWCGDGVCAPGESPASCPQDCGWCGDGVCAPGEATWCPQDCGTVTTLACQGIVICAACCAAGDAACRTACRQAGNQTARNEFNQFRTCAQNACPTQCAGTLGYECLLCAWASCQGICHFGSTGWQGCGQVVSCASNCPSVATGGNSQTCPSDAGVQCQSQCWAAGDWQSTVLYEDWLGCIAGSCGAICGPNGDPAACQQCQAQSCGAEAGACMGD